MMSSDAKEGQQGWSNRYAFWTQSCVNEDVSSKSYDRWNYMPEKRAGMARWDKFARAMLAKKTVRKPMKQAA